MKGVGLPPRAGGGRLERALGAGHWALGAGRCLPTPGHRRPGEKAAAREGNDSQLLPCGKEMRTGADREPSVLLELSLGSHERSSAHPSC